MNDKLLKIESNKWFLLTNRPDREAVTAAINELIGQRHKFIFSVDSDKFMRLSTCMFEWAAKHPNECEIKTRHVNGNKFYDLYTNGKLIAIK